MRLLVDRFVQKHRGNNSSGLQTLCSHDYAPLFSTGLAHRERLQYLYSRKSVTNSHGLNDDSLPGFSLTSSEKKTGFIVIKIEFNLTSFQSQFHIVSSVEGFITVERETITYGTGIFPLISHLPCNHC